MEEDFLVKSDSSSIAITSHCHCVVADVWRVEWRSSRSASFKQAPNKYNESLPFTHYMKPEEEEKTRPGETVTKRYMNDVWRGIQIGNGLYVTPGKRKCERRQQAGVQGSVRAMTCESCRAS